jgi:hypothetical protein
MKVAPGRRLDLSEFIRLCRCLEIDPAVLLGQIIRDR